MGRHGLLPALSSTSKAIEPEGTDLRYSGKEFRRGGNKYKPPRQRAKKQDPRIALEMDRNKEHL